MDLLQLGEEFQDAEIRAAAREQGAVSTGGQLAQPGDIGAGEDGAALLVLLVAGQVSSAVQDGDGLALGAADRHREDADAGFREIGGRGERISALVLAVGDQQHRLSRIAAAAAVEHFARLVEGIGDGRSLRRHADRLDGAQEQPGCGVVGGERALDERVAGEHHQADAISVQAVEERRDFQLRALDARRLHVPREHAVRGVERDDQIHARALDHIGALAALRAGGREEKEEQAQAEHRSFGDSLGGAAAAQHLIEARARDQRRYPLLPLPGPERRQRASDEAEGRNPEEERREDAQVLPEQRGLDPGHGAPCMRVPRRATPISPNSAAGTKKRAYHSS